jgi:iron(III) transport system substrate-binding protein
MTLQRHNDRRPSFFIRHWYLAALALASCLAPGCQRDAAPPPKEVVVYCSVDQDVAEPILAAFQKETGIQVRPLYDTEAVKTVGLAQRLRTEAAHPAADVFWSGEPFYTVRLAKEGLFVPWKPLGEPSTGNPSSTGRFWAAFALRARVIGYHTGRVKAEDAPERIEDLLNSKWKGRLVMASPEAGTTGGHMAALFVIYGKERAEAILKGLKANEVRLVDGNAVAARMVGTGQADVCLVDSDDVYVAQRNHWPVAMKYCLHDGRGALVIPNAAALVGGGPHPEEAQRLLDYLRGPEVEKKLAESDAHTMPLNAKVAAEFPATVIPNCLPIDYDKVADALPEAIEAATRILR